MLSLCPGESPSTGASQAPGKLQALILGCVPRVNSLGTSRSRGSLETTAHHTGWEEAEVLARAEGGCDGAGGVRTRARGKAPCGATQCEAGKDSCPREPPSLTTIVTAARAVFVPHWGVPWNSQK